MEDLRSYTVPRLKNLIKERGAVMPSRGTGKKGAVIKVDLIKALSL
jgi:hypothetical protein